MDIQKPKFPMTSPVFDMQGENPKLTDSSEDLEYQGSFLATAKRCRDLDWRLAAVDVRELVDLEVNFEEPVELWLRQCSQAGPLRGRVNLGVYTGSTSGLLVLEVQNGEGKSALDQCGSWRSSCRALVNGREQHYYVLPPGTSAPPTKFLIDAQVMMYGQDGLAPLPPSLHVQTQETWRWLKPPWESPPPDLPLSLWAFLQQASAQAPESDAEPVIPSWEEVYRLIIPHEQLLKVLLTTFDSLENHYSDLLEAALAEGFHEEEFLLGLLSNAPQGDILENPERRSQLEHMVREARTRPRERHESATSQDTAGPTPDKGVLVSKSRYEVMLGELRRLMHKAVELEAVLLDWGSPLSANPTPAPEVPMSSPHVPRHPAAQSPNNCLRSEKLLTVAYESLIKGNQRITHYSAMNTKAQKAPSPENPEVVETVNTCLLNNPDLARDPERLRMVQYCFTNYVNIDPNLSDLSLPERLERASQMAREFLGN
jgi:hypothetical protein